ncbi:uncharacterized protein FFB20_06959 [Fusarium fujikuroi]|uniref:Uncharacterized protein n=1 Tax=Fusarium fujikuroi TaxID=5127 RepID=A0A2H3SMI0_FUSFU|nr:uncharacterized protein Y057_2927 [Fusarium fujikuroi]QGI69812.1 hypothetical protein CEK27_002141 [Fusarium fujikuroi]QGI87182.1 hypothetical protein CEK25_002138 [Fusarium fujikuroi]QGJ00700.1 hypothetical protein CEK26_002144 [Fusarium fujikuroi]SCN83235.1 uncharacterized protein FFB20_06959 [Fusarium fujikuroi]
MATSPFTHLLSLPEETIDIICQNFCPCCSQSPSPRYFLSSEWSNPAYDRKCLFALSLTCQELRRISQLHLYHRLVGHDFMGFINTIHKTPALGQTPKELYVNEDVMMSLYLKYDNESKSGTPLSVGRWRLFTHYFEHLMLAVISLTPMLNRLEIYVHSDRQLWKTPSGCLPNLKELTITFRDGFKIEDHPDSLADLMHAAPRLERIELIKFKKLRASFRHDTVNELTLRSCMIHIGQMTGMMRDFPKLQTLRFSAPKDWQRSNNVSQQPGRTYKMEDFLMLRKDTLKHLILDYPGIEFNDPGEIVIQDLSMMKVLETLYIDSGMLHRRWEQDRLCTQRLCHLLPRSIKEFGLMGSAYPLVHAEVVQSINISAQAFPHLKKVVVARFDKEWPDDGDDWERTYASACEAANIELSSWLPSSVQHLMTQRGP